MFTDQPRPPTPTDHPCLYIIRSAMFTLYTPSDQPCSYTSFMKDWHRMSCPQSASWRPHKTLRTLKAFVILCGPDAQKTTSTPSKEWSLPFFQLRMNSTAVKLAWLKTKGSLGLQEGGQARLQKRLYQSTHEQTQGAKKRKKIAAAAKKKARQEKEAEEGGPAYQPGMF